MTKEGYCYKPFKQGKTLVMSIPAQLARALSIKKGLKVIICIDKNGNLIMEKYRNKIPEGWHLTVIRVIGGAKLKDGVYPQLGFTIPNPLSTKIKRKIYECPIIDEKKGAFFRIIFKVVKKEKIEAKAVPS